MAIIETLSYLPATIENIRVESPRTKTFRLKPSVPISFIAGQHVIVRVTATDGFMSSRHYSISSAPSKGHIEITVARAHDGSVSGWFHESARIGETVEITKPLGNMTWQSDEAYDALLIGGGIGTAPLMSIMREHKLQDHASSLTLLYSARNHDELCFKDDLFGSHEERVVVTLVESVPGDWQGHSGVINWSMIEPLLVSPEQRFYICGPYGFVQHVKDILISHGIDQQFISVENFTLS